jgi:hypothetical protein
VRIDPATEKTGERPFGLAHAIAEHAALSAGATGLGSAALEIAHTPFRKLTEVPSWREITSTSDEHNYI